MYIVVVGAGRIGFHLANKLVQDKHAVTVIEKNKERAEGIAQNLDAMVMSEWRPKLRKPRSTKEQMAARKRKNGGAK